MGHSTISMANFNSFLYVYQAGYPFGAAIFNRHPGIFLEFFCYFRDDLWMANVCVFIKIVVKPTIYSYHLDGKLYYSIIIQLYHNPVEGADGKWVISHGIKSRIVGSEWDYNGMIICIYIYIMLVGGLEHEFYDFPYIGNVIVPTDFHIFQRGRSTTNQLSTSIQLWFISHMDWNR